MTFTASGPVSLSGNEVTITGAGSVTITAHQAGAGDYSAAADVEQSFSVAKAGQTILFGPLAGKTYGDTPFNVSASGGLSGNDVTFSIFSGPATISGSEVTITGAGDVTVRASQAGNANYLAAASVDLTFTVAKATQSISFSAPATARSTDVITLEATGGDSGNAVTFSVFSGPGSLAGDVLTFTGAGTVVVRASQAGSANYEAAADVDQTITVALNHAPVAVVDAVTTTTGDTTLYPLANDTDAEGDLLEIDSVSNTAQVKIVGRSLIIKEGFTGQFDYVVTDGSGTDTGTVTVTAGAEVTGARFWSGLLYDAGGAVVGRAHIAGIIGQNSSVSLRVGGTAAIAKFRLTAPSVEVVTTLGTFTVDVTGTGRLDVTLKSGSNTFSGRLRPANQSAPRGVYHVALAGAERAVVPGGGVARIVVGVDGKMTVTCRLPDTKTVTFNSNICDNGSFTFYGMVPGTSPRAAVSGECTLANLLQTDVTGELLWVKPVQSPATGLHRTGVDTVLTANGSAFIAGSALPNGAVSVHLEGGNLASEINLSGTVVPGRVSATGASFTWNMNPKAPAWIKATLTLPSRTNPVIGGGLYLPKSNRVWGWFPGTTVGGYFEIAP